ncbi:hypothetical protein ACFRAQ_24390 [Nocardia sp. NPDC056611]|uniref:DUF7768 domain-containing protein n=1 Tax=Nocardia sp. NPDC056611 TaxID=3345877 RepID=UPI00366E3A4D
MPIHTPPLVIIESPYAGDVEANLAYARAALLDSLNRGEYPFASHLLYTQVLTDADADQRSHGIAAGLAWGAHACLTAAESRPSSAVAGSPRWRRTSTS